MTVGDVQERLLQVKPTETAVGEKNRPGFTELQAINPDVCAWLSLDNTGIDYPVLQGTSNYSYINTDVYGNFALAGSIFLDSRNDAGYNDLYSLLYGHNMSQHRMFSDVNLYKDEAFFKENKLGLMLLPDGYHILESISVILTHASDSGLFNPENWTYLDAEGILRMATEERRLSVNATSPTRGHFFRLLLVEAASAPLRMKQVMVFICWICLQGVRPSPRIWLRLGWLHPGSECNGRSAGSSESGPQDR